MNLVNDYNWHFIRRSAMNVYCMMCSSRFARGARRMQFIVSRLAVFFSINNINLTHVKKREGIFFQFEKFFKQIMNYLQSGLHYLLPKT